MITVYSEIESSRLTYICNFIFGSVLCLEFELVYSIDVFTNSSQQKINYSNKQLGGIQIIPNGLLSETKIEIKEVNVSEWHGLTTFFPNEDGDIPFDLFSAAFFLISRYEEYWPSERDNHDRFLSNNSILQKHGILKQPIIDLWCKQLNKELIGSSKLNRTYKYISTIDVDNAYAYRFKSFTVKVGGTIKSLLKGTTDDLSRRLGCYFRKKDDPYDTYDVIHQVHKNAEITGMYFFLLSDRNQWDRNLSHSNKYYRGLISALQRENIVGIHPGYNSYLSTDIMHTEKLRLEDIIDGEVINSRQHFLRFNFPETPRNIIKCGLTNDYSLGYAEALGFRAGTCTPFKYFDLLENKTTQLTMHSSAIMDATLNRYLGLSPEEAITEVNAIINEVKAVSGELITIWHNETLSEINEWEGWMEVFKNVVSSASNNETA